MSTPGCLCLYADPCLACRVDRHCCLVTLQVRSRALSLYVSAQVVSFLACLSCTITRLDRQTDRSSPPTARAHPTVYTYTGRRICRRTYISKSPSPPALCCLHKPLQIQANCLDMRDIRRHGHVHTETRPRAPSWCAPAEHLYIHPNRHSTSLHLSTSDDLQVRTVQAGALYSTFDWQCLLKRSLSTRLFRKCFPTRKTFLFCPSFAQSLR